MDLKRLWRTIRLCTTRKRSDYLRRAHIFAAFGENSVMSSRKIPLYPELISIGNNVRLAANVSLIPHDMIHAMLNNRIPKIGNGGGGTRNLSAVSESTTMSLWERAVRFSAMYTLGAMSLSARVRWSIVTLRAATSMRAFRSRKSAHSRNFWKNAQARFAIRKAFPERAILSRRSSPTGCGMIFAVEKASIPCGSGNRKRKEAPVG